MDIIHSFLLGVVQGFTEFLPISSSAHLVLLPKIINMKSEILDSLTFDVILHSGTLIAVFLYYRKKIKNLFIGFLKGIFNVADRYTNDFKLSIFLIVATVPSFLAGFILNDYAEKIFRNPLMIGVIFIIFALFLLFADKNKNLFKDVNQITIIDALVIGCSQALAIMPGVSRSGVTITAALLLGLKRQDAANFSFLLSVPVISGAILFKTGDIFKIGASENITVLLTGFISSFIAGFIAILFLVNFVKKNTYIPFVIYRLLLGFIIVILVLKGII